MRVHQPATVTGAFAPSSSSAEMKSWIRDAERYDDLTFIVMKVR